MSITPTIQLLVRNNEVAGIADDWTLRLTEGDLRIRRSKTPGCAVIETQDAIFANHVRIWHPGCRVKIKEEKQ